MQLQCRLFPTIRVGYSKQIKNSKNSMKLRATQYDPLALRISRGTIIGSIPIAIGALFEINTRPKFSEDYIETLENLTEAEKIFKLAQNQLQNGDFKSAIQNYEKVIQLVPQQYTLCMKSFLGLRDAYFGLGYRKEGGEYGKQEWLWGRGIRWPGWYIIAAILLRNEIVRKKMQ
eukprot:TRINITY_DN4928_c0_g1_i1.p1 TRINITY_DN4928_c0_g1~~TRINITY_DN4928_c0_g1_i1.p1  ORF type:complete len:193 (-),score=14.75 TRINITY_DN4928_c0_g1_i1:134-655(-)